MGLRIALSLVFGLHLMGALDVQAAKAPLSLEKLKKKATHITTGKVVSVTSRIQKSEIETGRGIHRDKVFTIKLKVASVSKGDDVKSDEEIVIEAWRPSTRIPPEPGLQGHVPIPQKGDVVTVYVGRKKGKAFEPLLPNGMQIRQESNNNSAANPNDG